MWTAFDIDNAHPTIHYQVLKAHGFSAPKLEMYCDDREAILKEVMVTYGVERKAAKLLFIRLLYLGEFQAWATDNNLIDVKETTFIKEFSGEMCSIADIIVKHNPIMRESLKPNDRSTEKAAKKGRGYSKIIPAGARLFFLLSVSP